MTVVLSIVDLLSRRKDFARRCAWNTILQPWNQDYPFTWLSRARSVSLSLCACIFLASPKRRNLFLNQQRLIRYFSSLNKEGLHRKSAVFPVLLFSCVTIQSNRSLYWHLFITKSSSVRTLTSQSSVRIIQLWSLYVFELSRCVHYRGILIIEVPILQRWSYYWGAHIKRGVCILEVGPHEDFQH